MHWPTLSRQYKALKSQPALLGSSIQTLCQGPPSLHGPHLPTCPIYFMPLPFSLPRCNLHLLSSGLKLPCKPYLFSIWLHTFMHCLRKFLSQQCKATKELLSSTFFRNVAQIPKTYHTEQWFSNLIVHKNHLEMIKMQISRSLPHKLPRHRELRKLHFSKPCQPWTQLF